MSQTPCLSCCALLYTKRGDETAEGHKYLIIIFLLLVIVMTNILDTVYCLRLKTFKVLGGRSCLLFQMEKENPEINFL